MRRRITHDEERSMRATAHILVIDDDCKITDAVRRGLAYQGYRVDVAHSGADGLEKTRRWPPGASRRPRDRAHHHGVRAAGPAHAASAPGAQPRPTPGAGLGPGY